jgi:hypothetical protein
MVRQTELTKRLRRGVWLLDAVVIVLVIVFLIIESQEMILLANSVILIMSGSVVTVCPQVLT